MYPAFNSGISKPIKNIQVLGSCLFTPAHTFGQYGSPSSGSVQPQVYAGFHGGMPDDVAVLEFLTRALEQPRVEKAAA